MELDELKKSWEMLDAKLPQSPLTDEEQITHLIAQYRKSAGKSLRNLIGFQYFSLCIGIIALLACLLAGGYIATWNNEIMQEKGYVLLVFLGTTLLGGIAWDYKTYRWIHNTKLYEMPVSQVSRRMITFSRWMRYEIIAICIWALLFNGLFYWIMEHYRLPGGAQACVIGLPLLITLAAIYALYKHLIYKPLNNIHKNIEELKDLCTE